jgi:hypothetical protein
MHRKAELERKEKEAADQAAREALALQHAAERAAAALADGIIAVDDDDSPEDALEEPEAAVEEPGAAGARPARACKRRVAELELMIEEQVGLNNHMAPAL